MNSFTNDKLDFVTENSFGGFNESVIRQHWNNIIGHECLAHDETIRLVVMPSPTSKMAQNGNIATGGWADKEQIRTCDQLIDRLRLIQGTETPGAIGFALSAGVYSFEPNKPSNYSTLKYIQNMIIDVDAHKNDITKDRFNLTIIKPDYLRTSAILMLNYINSLLEANGLPFVAPVYTAITGGGYQFGVRFDRPLDRESGKKVFETFGAILGFNYINKKETASEEFKKEQEINNKALAESNIEFESKALGNDTTLIPLPGSQDTEIDGLQNIKKKKGIKVNIKSFQDEWYNPFLEIDNSFKDVTHAQRIPGTINQKYEAFAYIDSDLVKPEGLEQTIERINDEVYRDLSITDTDRNNIVDLLRKSLTRFRTTVLKDSPTGLFTKQPTEQIKALSGIIQYANSEQRTLGAGDYINLTEVEKQVLAALSKNSEMIKSVLGDMGIEIVKDSTSYLACRSPFRTDSKPSLAVYTTNNRATIKDFTEDKTYNLITLWMAVNNCNKAAAIEQLALKYNITIDKTDKKEFQKIQTTDSVMDLIKQVNTQDYVYYRLANATKNCIIKSVKTGNSRTFDGYKVLADHILKYQLGIRNPDSELMKQFEESFLQYIIIDAFEDFLPGGERVFEDDFIQYVNIWTASEGYRLCWAESEKLQDMNIDEALNLIKEVCPSIHLFLLQITQKGDLKYFLNWLNAISKFKYLPIVPIFPSIEGAGKNLFASEILAPYLNKNYITIANGQQMQSNFNSFMGHSNLIIADEGDFTGSREFDQLKLLTGNDTVRVEKKGVDAQTMPRRFNICMFTNGTEPVRHSITDRRCVYNKLEHTLEATLIKTGKYENINQFIENIRSEVYQFWGIIIKTKLNKQWMNHNIKNGQYYYQILMMHPFGKLVLKIIENKWDEISLQLNEKQKELQDEKINMQLLQNIESSFFEGEPLPLITINKYLDAMSWKSSTSIQEFINKNKLQQHGVEIIVDQDSIKIKLDAIKLQELVFQENNLSEIVPEFAVPKIKTLAELKEELQAKRSERFSKGQSKANKGFANVHSSTASMSAPISKGPGFSDANFSASNMPPMPGGLPTIMGIPESNIPAGIN